MSTPETPATGASEQEAPVCYRHPDREAHIRCQRCERSICPDCMQPAAVGFQCPSCVREGSKATRSARTAYGGQRSANPARTSQVLVALNVLVWVLVLAAGGDRGALVDQLALTPLGGTFATSNGLITITGVADAPWQLLTSVFTHVALWHIGFNMLVLWTLGPQLELAVGRLRFLAIYLLSGLAGSAAVLWLSAPTSSTLGASGAIFGMLGALLVIAAKARGDVRGIATWIGINLVITFVLPFDISWQGHLGGLAGGLLVGAAVVYAPRGERRPLWQAAGVGAVAVAVVLATAVRFLQLS
ncbi:MAG TPA: rhomboid family intramembrane serine protease [Nocardioidaceae bacterium]|nr:rhomboid family intramembrane serine protease [Nocardioidaceae bacterium]